MPLYALRTKLQSRGFLSPGAGEDMQTKFFLSGRTHFIWESENWQGQSTGRATQANVFGHKYWLHSAKQIWKLELVLMNQSSQRIFEMCSKDVLVQKGKYTVLQDKQNLLLK